MKKIIFVLLTLSMLFFVGCKSEPVEWLTDLDQAMLAAEENNKDLLIFFSGLGWDGYSEQFTSEILSKDAFLKEVGTNYVPVQLNILLDEEGLTEEEIVVNQSNYMIAYSLGVSSVPSIMVLTKDGNPYGSILYTEDTTVESVVADFKAIKKAGDAISKLTGKIEKATGVNKAELIDELYSSVSEEFSYLFTDYIAEFPSLDPENKTGKLGKYKLLLAYDESLAIFNESGDIDAAAQVFINLAESGLLTVDEYQTAYYNAAYLESYGGQIVTENTVPYLQKAYDAAPESELADSILLTIESLTSLQYSTGDE